MNNEELNKLAVKAGTGCSDSYLAILTHFLPRIYSTSDYIWHSVTDQTKFEESCISGIESSIKRFEYGRGNFSAMVNWMIVRYSHQYCGRFKKKRRGYSHESIEEPTKTDRTGNIVSLEVTDDLAIVDDELIVTEKVALLAEDDSRKLAILTAWTNGEFNDSETASFLAKRYGGNSESHRKFINRFRITCRKTLATPSTA